MGHLEKTGVHRKGELTLEELIRSARKGSRFQEAGAMGLFIGIVRGKTRIGEEVQKLELQAYEQKANEVLKKISEDLKRKDGVVDVRIHHMLGDFVVSEDLVYVLVAATHREKLFPVLIEATERYKEEVPIFKKENIVTQEGRTKAYWVSELRGNKQSGG